ncbi:MAG: hypothetical protein O3A87_07365 [Verrucomicrobia bacterium]|nr:hypothetical protein [Verrucomicrobiota bacterium]MDA1006286.1 hypothetical protein [Verrucomicrobiota bacterium]
MEVTLAEFFMVILGACFLGAGISGFIDRRRDRVRANAIKRSTVRCRVCGCAYEAPDRRVARACPQCGRENFRGRDRRLG